MRIRDGKNSDLESGINIPNPQHCLISVFYFIVEILGVFKSKSKN
jgi:hypothetical protein